MEKGHRYKKISFTYNEYVFFMIREMYYAVNNRSYWQFQAVPGIKSTASYETRIISLRTPLFFLAEALFGESYKILDLN